MYFVKDAVKWGKPLIGQEKFNKNSLADSWNWSMFGGLAFAKGNCRIAQ
jgi:hypothetical protein